MLYTIVPVELVMEKREPETGSELSVGGGILEGVRDGADFRVTRLISTDPRMYLDKRYAPGEMIKQSARK